MTTARDKFYYTRTLCCLLKALEGIHTEIELRNESHVKGTVESVSAAMNVTMRNCELIVAGRSKYLQRLLVQGRKIRMVIIPDDINMIEAMQHVIGMYQYDSRVQGRNEFKRTPKFKQRGRGKIQESVFGRGRGVNDSRGRGRGRGILGSVPGRGRGNDVNSIGRGRGILGSVPGRGRGNGELQRGRGRGGVQTGRNLAGQDHDSGTVLGDSGYEKLTQTVGDPAYMMMEQTSSNFGVQSVSLDETEESCSHTSQKVRQQMPSQARDHHHPVPGHRSNSSVQESSDIGCVGGVISPRHKSKSPSQDQMCFSHPETRETTISEMVTKVQCPMISSTAKSKSGLGKPDLGHKIQEHLCHHPEEPGRRHRDKSHHVERCSESSKVSYTYTSYSSASWKLGHRHEHSSQRLSPEQESISRCQQSKTKKTEHKKHHSDDSHDSRSHIHGRSHHSDTHSASHRASPSREAHHSHTQPSKSKAFILDSDRRERRHGAPHSDRRSKGEHDTDRYDQRQSDEKQSRSDDRPHSRDRPPSKERLQSRDRPQSSNRSDSRGRDRANSRDRDRGNPRDRPRSRERLDLRDRPHSKDRTNSWDRLHSRDRPKSRERPHSTERPDSRDRPHSTERPDSRDRPRSRERPDSRDRPHSRERPDSRDRLRSRERPVLRDRRRSSDRPGLTERLQSRDGPNSRDRPKPRDRPEPRGGPPSRERPKSRDRPRSRDRLDLRDRPQSTDRSDLRDWLQSRRNKPDSRDRR